MKGKDVLAVAVHELGAKESPPNSNDVKYNTWYYGREVSGDAYPWCMAFVQWCYKQAGIPLPFRTASCGALLRWYRENEPQCVVGVEDAIPGCIVIFDFPGTEYNTDHTGIFESAGSKYVTTIDGNTGSTSEADGGMVARRTRPISDVAACIVPRSLKERQMCRAELPVLQYGDVGSDTMALQALLNLRGASIAVDGSFGPATLRAVKDFQGAHDLVVDGSVGPATWPELISA